MRSLINKKKEGGKGAHLHMQRDLTVDDVSQYVSTLLELDSNERKQLQKIASVQFSRVGRMYMVSLRGNTELLQKGARTMGTNTESKTKDSREGRVGLSVSRDDAMTNYTIYVALSTGSSRVPPVMALPHCRAQKRLQVFLLRLCHIQDPSELMARYNLA